jgi:type IV pilus assembly protein PilM
MAKKIQTLNIGASTVTLAEYESSGRSLRLVKYGMSALAAPLDAENASTVLTPALMEIMREKGIKPGKVAICVSGQMVFPRFAAITPVGSSEKFDQLVRYEIEQNVPFPIDEMVCDRQILGDTENGDKAVMIVGAKVDQIEAITDAVASAGFTPEIVDVAPLALTNVLKAARGDGECAVILDIGAKTTSLVIVEGEKLYNRSIPVAGNQITKEIAQLLGCTPEEADGYKRESAYVSLGGVTEDEDETLDRMSKVCRAVMTRLHAEISRSINFYRSQQGGGTPAKLYLTGGTSLLPQVDQFFRDSLQIEVEYLNPGELLGGVDLGADAVYLAVSTGVALHAAGASAIAINLLPPSIVEARAEVARIPFVAFGAIAAAAAAICWLFASQSETEKVKEQNETIVAQANGLKSVKTRVEGAKAKADEAFAAAEDLAKRLARRNMAVERMRLLRKAVEPELWIAKWEDRVEKTVVPDPKGRGEKEIETPVTHVWIRCWKNDGEALVKAETERLARSDAGVSPSPAADAGVSPSPATETEGSSSPAAADAGGSQTSATEAEGSPSPAADAEKRPSRRRGTSLTVGMIVRDRLDATGLCVPGSVSQVDTKYLGKGGCLEQYEMVMQFKEPEYK